MRPAVQFQELSFVENHTAFSTLKLSSCLYSDVDVNLVLVRTPKDVCMYLLSSSGFMVEYNPSVLH